MSDTGRYRSSGLLFLAGVMVGAGLVSMLAVGSRTAPASPEPRSGLDPLTAPATAYAWTAHPDPAFPMPPYSEYLAGVRIVLDPGHGGRAHLPNWKRGPTGLREAEVNLRVALRLREFLESAGAEVLLTREDDRYLAEDASEDLRLRAEMANECRADLLLSIHHNAAARPEANYTSVFYHGAPDAYPANVSAARHILDGLSEALRLEQHLGCGLVSDYAIYPDDGFAVLRHARVPAVLSEASFHSNPEEEDRLRDPLYNRREAYGLFLGLARWARGGLPRVELLEVKPRRNGLRALLQLDDGLRVRGGLGAAEPKLIASTLRVEAGGQSLPYSFDAEDRRLVVTVPKDTPELFVDFANVFGQHVVHPRVLLPD